MSKGLTSPRRRIPIHREARGVGFGHVLSKSVAVFITARRTTTAPERRRDARYEGEERIVVITVESDSFEEVARSNEEKQVGQSPFL